MISTTKGITVRHKMSHVKSFFFEVVVFGGEGDLGLKGSSATNDKPLLECAFFQICHYILVFSHLCFRSFCVKKFFMGIYKMI